MGHHLSVCNDDAPDAGVMHFLQCINHYRSVDLCFIRAPRVYLEGWVYWCDRKGCGCHCNLLTLTEWAHAWHDTTAAPRRAARRRAPARTSTMRQQGRYLPVALLGAKASARAPNCMHAPTTCSCQSVELDRRPHFLARRKEKNNCPFLHCLPSLLASIRFDDDTIMSSTMRTAAWR